MCYGYISRKAASIECFLLMLLSSTVLDAVNISDSEVSDQNTDSNTEQSVVLECKNEQGEPTPQADLGTGNENVTEAKMGSSMSSTSAISLLNILRAPRPSDLTRKRKLQCNPGKRKKTKPPFSVNSELKGVKPQDRVGKYPNDSLSVLHFKLFCTACREELSVKSSSLANRLKSQSIKRVRND